MNDTGIAWTEKTWNPVTGCTKHSEGCRNCYAETMARRLKAMGAKGYEDGFKVTLHPERLGEPLKLKGRNMVFVCSMGDLFHEDVPWDFVDKVLEVVDKTPKNTYQILTKRADCMRTYFKLLEESSTRYIPENVWLGVTVENREAKERIGCLRDIKTCAVRFLSCEPLLEDLGELDLRGIGWVIVGGESGAKARPMKEEWVLNVRRQCEEQGVPFFFKQWGTWGADALDATRRRTDSFCRGKNSSFKTSAEAVEYARKNLKKEILINLKSEIRMLKQEVARIKQLEIMIAEAKSKTVDLREAWKVIETMNTVKLESKGAKASMFLFFKINLESKKGLYYAREFVKYYGAAQIKMISEEIRKRKEWVKYCQRRYSELEA